MGRQFNLIFSFIFGIYGVLSFDLYAKPTSPVSIAGWPIPSFSMQEPSSWLANDPVLGRMICPSLTRLHLQKHESEPLILKNVEVLRHSDGVIWNLSLRNGIYWWSGKEVHVQDLFLFLKTHLEKIIKEKTSTPIPEYSIDIVSDHLRIVWKKEPEFGPYILNDFVFWRERKTEDSIKFECVGRYIPVPQGSSFLLLPNERYPNDKQTYLFESLEEFRKEKKRGYEFVMSEDQTLSPQTVLKASPCECLLDLPLMSVILWKEHLDVSARKHLSSLIPRQPLREVAGGFWARLPSSLVPRNHPGYDESLQVPHFSLKKQMVIERKPLYLSTVRGDLGLLEKVLSETFQAGGWDVQFLAQEDARVEGVISGVFVPWSSVDLYDAFHSQGKSKLVKTEHANLNKALDLYRRSLTQKHPDFQQLKHVHRYLYELEWVSVVMQHQICLKFNGLNKKKGVSMHDPDWFINILLASGRVS